MTEPTPTRLPHSRACGLRCDGHVVLESGVRCSHDCPTCGGDPTKVPAAPAAPDVRDQVGASPWLSAAWAQTYTGVAFRPWTAEPDDVVLEDIAHSLAYQCRYNGHTREFYSVAQHAVLLASYALNHAPSDALELAYWCLFHDAAEAYIGDMVRPVKVEMPEFRALDDALTATIAVRFGLDGTAIPPYVGMLDARILLDERDALLTAPPKAWDVDDLKPLGISIVSWTPAEAEAQFLGMFSELERRRAELRDRHENPNAPERGSLARVFYDHDFDRMECGDHDGRCCPVAAGDPSHPCHNLSESQHRHYERMVEAGGFLGDGSDL